MKLLLERMVSDDEVTIGMLWLEDRAVCFTLEDEYRTVKVAAETRIPAGTYRIAPRTEGGMIQRYKRRFPWHKGMLHLLDVPGFKYVYIHVGNTDADTAGCILVGRGADLGRMSIQGSVPAYQALYGKIYDAAEAGELEITIEDRDR